MKKQELVNSGNFATGTNSKGNFNAYGQETGRFFIHKALMETLGWKKNEDVVLPFYAIIEEKELDLVDADNQPTGEKSKRTQASAIFKTEEEMLKAYTSSARFAAKAQALVNNEVLDAKIALAQRASAAHLTEAQLKLVMDASI